MITLDIFFTVPGESAKRTIHVKLDDPVPLKGATWICAVHSSPISFAHVNPFSVFGEGSWDAAKYAIGFVYSSLRTLELHCGYKFYWPDGENLDLDALVSAPK